MPDEASRSVVVPAVTLRDRLVRPLSSALFVAAAGLAASATSLGNRFALDDLPIIADNASVHTLRGWWHLFATTYWPPRFGATLYRPLTTLAFATEWTIGHGAPLIFHLTSAVLYVAICVAMLFVLRALVAPEPALIAALLFAVHPLHVEPVANVVGQSELLVALACLVAALLYLRARLPVAIDGTRDTHLTAPARAPSARAGAAIVSLFTLALLAKEHAIVLPGLLLAIEILVVRDAEGWRTRIRAIAPLGAALVVMAVAYLIVRRAVVGTWVGEDPVMPMEGTTRVWTFLRIVPEWVRLFLWPARLSADYSPPGIPVLAAPSVDAIPGAIIVIGVVTLFLATRRRLPIAWLGVVWVAVALAPISNLLVVTGILIAERTMFLSTAGVAITAAALVSAMGAASPGRLVVLRVACAVLILLGLVKSAGRQRVWRDDATLVAQTAVDAPLGYRAQYLYGQSLFGRGDRVEGERRLREAIRLNPNPNDADPLNFLATQYRMAGLCPQALPLYREAVARAPRRPDARFGLATCLFESGAFTDARREADAGLASGMLQSLFRDIARRADSALARP